MGAENHRLALIVASPEDGSHVAGFPHRVLYVHFHISLYLEGEGAETGLFGIGHSLVHIHSGGGEELAGAFFVDPALDGQLVHVPGFRVVEGQVVRHVPVHAHVPAVTGGFRVVHHQAAGGAVPDGFLKLVQPSAVIGHVAAPEEGGVIKAGIVHQGYHNLALHIYILVVVPAVLRRRDAEAAEHVFGLGDNYLVRRTGRPDYCIVRIFQDFFFLSIDRQLVTNRCGRYGD